MCIAHICIEESKTQWSWSQGELLRGSNIWICIWKDKSLLISYFEACSWLANKGMESWAVIGKNSLQTTRRRFKIILVAIKNNQFHIINSLCNWSLLFWIISLSYFLSCVQVVLKNISRHDDILNSIPSNSEFLWLVKRADKSMVFQT